MSWCICFLIISGAMTSSAVDIRIPIESWDCPRTKVNGFNGIFSEYRDSVFSLSFSTSSYEQKFTCVYLIG